MREPLQVPSAARLAGWLNAWLDGAASADDTIAGICGTGARCEFSLPDEPALPVAIALGRIRRAGTVGAAAALPVPGDPVGLGGPAEFNASAVEAGGAVLLLGAGVGLVAEPGDGGERWVGQPAQPPAYAPDLATADRELRAALRHVVAELERLDVAAWRPEVADELMNLRAPSRLDSAVPFPTPEAERLAITGLRCLRIHSLALADDGGALTADEVRQRRDALAALGSAARVAVAAAASAPARSGT